MELKHLVKDLGLEDGDEIKIRGHSRNSAGWSKASESCPIPLKLYVENMKKPSFKKLTFGLVKVNWRDCNTFCCQYMLKWGPLGSTEQNEENIKDRNQLSKLLSRLELGKPTKVCIKATNSYGSTDYTCSYTKPSFLFDIVWLTALALGTLVLTAIIINQ